MFTKKVSVAFILLAAVVLVGAGCASSEAAASKAMEAIRGEIFTEMQQTVVAIAVTELSEAYEVDYYATSNCTRLVAPGSVDEVNAAFEEIGVSDVDASALYEKADTELMNGNFVDLICNNNGQLMTTFVTYDNVPTIEMIPLEIKSGVIELGEGVSQRVLSETYSVFTDFEDGIFLLGSAFATNSMQAWEYVAFNPYNGDTEIIESCVADAVDIDAAHRGEYSDRYFLCDQQFNIGT